MYAFKLPVWRRPLLYADQKELRAKTDDIIASLSDTSYYIHEITNVIRHCSRMELEPALNADGSFDPGPLRVVLRMADVCVDPDLCLDDDDFALDFTLHKTGGKTPDEHCR